MDLDRETPCMLYNNNGDLFTREAKIFKSKLKSIKQTKTETYFAQKRFKAFMIEVFFVRFCIYAFCGLPIVCIF